MNTLMAVPEARGEATSKKKGPSHYAFIDALRGVAFLMVLAIHVGDAMSRSASGSPRSLGDRGLLPPKLDLLLASFGSGVSLFFVLSATTLFLSLDARESVDRRPVVAYSLRRLFRIAPLFWAGAAFYTSFFEPFDSGAPKVVTAFGLLATIGFVHTWSPYWVNQVVPGGWSIGSEMMFYTIVPTLKRRISSLHLAIWWTLAAQVLSVALEGVGRKLIAGLDLSPVQVLEFFKWWPPAQLPKFGIGIILYFLIRPGRHEEASGPRGRSAIAAPLLVSALYLYYYWAMGNLDSRSPIIELIFLLGCLGLAWHPFRPVVNGFTRFVGTLSFSAYLTHFAVLKFVSRYVDLGPLAGSGWPVRLVAIAGPTLALTLAASWVTHRFIEVPGQKLGRRLIDTIGAGSR